MCGYEKGGRPCRRRAWEFIDQNVAELALKHGLPAATQTRSFAESAALCPYGAMVPTYFRQTALFVAKILQVATLQICRF